MRYFVSNAGARPLKPGHPRYICSVHGPGAVYAYGTGFTPEEAEQAAHVIAKALNHYESTQNNDTTEPAEEPK